MKTKEELNALKEEIENVNEKLQELTPEELEKVTGGISSSAIMGVTGIESGAGGFFRAKVEE